MSSKDFDDSSNYKTVDVDDYGRNSSSYGGSSNRHDGFRGERKFDNIYNRKSGRSSSNFGSKRGGGGFMRDW